MAGMHNPAHPGEIIRDAFDEKGWTASEAATRLGVAQNGLSQVLNGTAGMRPHFALALERLGWSDAGHWRRMQGAHDLARGRAPDRAVSEGLAAAEDTGEAPSAVSLVRYGRA